MVWKVTIKGDLSAAIARKLRGRAQKASDLASQQLQALVIDRVVIEADKTLHKLAAAYKAGIRQPGTVTLQDGKVVVKLKGIAREIEVGWPGFDMKTKLLAKATKRGKDGSPYVDVPFAWTELGSLAGQRMPDSLASFFKGEIAKAKKRKEPTATIRSNEHTYRQGFTRMIRQPNGGALAMKVRGGRGDSDQMIRRGFKQGGAVRNAYSTIRRISQRSPASSWWHPGFKGVHLFPKVLKALPKYEINIILLQAFQSVGLKVLIK